jgi:hypothetical protein
VSMLLSFLLPYVLSSHPPQRNSLSLSLILHSRSIKMYDMCILDSPPCMVPK